MSTIRRNLVANAVGRGWTAFLGLAVLPLYIRLLGPEAYGLVGIYTTLAVICSLCDIGISASLGRELARVRTEPDSPRRLAELVRTAEVIYFAIGLGLGTLIALVAPLIVRHWLNLHDLTPAEATRAVQLMGGFMVFQWPVGLYTSGLGNLQRQVALNVFNVLGSTVRALGTVAVLYWGSATVTAFYLWQVPATAAMFIASREVLWRSPEISRRDAAFRLATALSVRRFAGGVTIIVLLSVIVAQLDKVVLSRLVELKAFGYYSFATSIAGGIAFFSQPVLTATYPPMIEAYALRDTARLTRIFRRGSQLLSVALFAPAAVVAVFSPLVLRLWTHDPETAANAAGLVSGCILGTSLYATTYMPYNLTLAAGQVRPAIIAGVAGAVTYAVALAVLTPRIGVLAGAVGSTIVNALVLVLYARFGVGVVLPGQAARWLFADVGLPLLVATLAAVLVRGAVTAGASRQVELLVLGLASLITLVCTALTTSTGRQEILARSRRVVRWVRRRELLNAEARDRP
jgi:O-antigen/teichoic acid export membrane protein